MFSYFIKDEKLVQSSHQGLPYNPGSIMNVDPQTLFGSISSDEHSSYDYYGVHYLDYLHINLLYCGGTAVIGILMYVCYWCKCALYRESMCTWNNTVSS